MAKILEKNEYLLENERRKNLENFNKEESDKIKSDDKEKHSKINKYFKSELEKRLGQGFSVVFCLCDNICEITKNGVTRTIEPENFREMTELNVDSRLDEITNELRGMSW